MPRIKIPNATRAVGYIRVSKGIQELSPEAQRGAIEQWAQSNGAVIVDWFADTVTGAAELGDRPGLMAALASMKPHRAGLLIVAKRDRLARSPLAALLVERMASAVRARVVSADGMANDDTPEGQMMRGMLDLFAQYERAMIQLRTRAALSVKRQRGERVGQVPFGYRLAADRKRLEEEPSEQRAIAFVLRLHAEGRSQEQIAHALSLSEHKPRGERWHRGTVQRILARARGET